MNCETGANIISILCMFVVILFKCSNCKVNSQPSNLDIGLDVRTTLSASTGE